MSPSSVPDRHDEAFWRDYLTRGASMERRARRVFRAIPHGPRCKLCLAPFSGIGGPLMRLIGKRASDKNPEMCTTCFDFIVKHHGGAEIECTFLFADVRGSTSMAERMSATEFRAILDRFYGVATDVVIKHDGSIDKFVGDELVAMYFPLLSGDRHAARAVETATALLTATGHGGAGDPWLPIGAGVHGGIAWVGAVGEGARVELTALGDTVNTAARLAAAAGAGEVLVSASTAAVAGLQTGLERRTLERKGKAQPTEVVVLRA
jgi:adenylate cyclase